MDVSWKCKNCGAIYILEKLALEPIEDLIGIWANNCSKCKTETILYFDGEKFTVDVEENLEE